jgi:hypothetical protein
VIAGVLAIMFTVRVTKAAHVAVRVVGLALPAVLLTVPTSAADTTRREDIESAARAIYGDVMSPYCPGLLLADCRSAGASADAIARIRPDKRVPPSPSRHRRQRRPCRSRDDPHASGRRARSPRTRRCTVAPPA